jgi:hypothetical protein
VQVADNPSNSVGSRGCIAPIGKRSAGVDKSLIQHALCPEFVQENNKLPGGSILLSVNPRVEGDHTGALPHTPRFSEAQGRLGNVIGAVGASNLRPMLETATRYQSHISIVYSISSCVVGQTNPQILPARHYSKPLHIMHARV